MVDQILVYLTWVCELRGFVDRLTWHQVLVCSLGITQTTVGGHTQDLPIISPF